MLTSLSLGGHGVGILAARGRGLGKLIEGVMAGDPVSIGITAVIVVGLIGWGVYKVSRSGDSE